MGAVRVGIASKIYPVVCAKEVCNRWKMMILSVTSYLSVLQLTR